MIFSISQHDRRIRAPYPTVLLERAFDFAQVGPPARPLMPAAFRRKCLAAREAASCSSVLATFSLARALLALRAWTASAGSGRLGAPLGNTRSPPPGWLGKSAGTQWRGAGPLCALMKRPALRGFGRVSSDAPMLAAASTISSSVSRCSACSLVVQFCLQSFVFSEI